jgi:hypothetical protein
MVEKEQPEQIPESKPNHFYISNESQDDFTVKEIVDENFEPLTFGVKPFGLPGSLTPLFPNLTL